MDTAINNHAPARSGLLPRGVVGIASLALLVTGAARADADPRWYFRLGILRASAEIESVSVDIPLDIAPGVKLAAGFLPNGAIAVEPLTLPGGNIGYILPVLDDHLAIEALVAIPQKVKVIATGTLANESILPTVLGLPTGIPPLGSPLVEVNPASPVFTAVYRTPLLGGRITPVLGAGAVVLLGADVQVANPLLERYLNLEFEVAPTFGAIAQAGVDIRLWGRLQARIDVKYIAVSANVAVKHIQFKTGLPIVGNVDIGDTQVSARAHAWMGQLGVGFDL